MKMMNNEQMPPRDGTDTTVTPEYIDKYKLLDKSPVQAREIMEGKMAQVLRDITDADSRFNIAAIECVITLVKGLQDCPMYLLWLLEDPLFDQDFINIFDSPPITANVYKNFFKNLNSTRVNDKLSIFNTIITKLLSYPAISTGISPSLKEILEMILNGNNSGFPLLEPYTSKIMDNELSPQDLKDNAIASFIEVFSLNFHTEEERDFIHSRLKSVYALFMSQNKMIDLNYVILYYELLKALEEKCQKAMKTKSGVISEIFSSI